MEVTMKQCSDTGRGKRTERGRSSRTRQSISIKVVNEQQSRVQSTELSDQVGSWYPTRVFNSFPARHDDVEFASWEKLRLDDTKA